MERTLVTQQFLARGQSSMWLFVCCPTDCSFSSGKIEYAFFVNVQALGGSGWLRSTTATKKL